MLLKCTEEEYVEAVRIQLKNNKIFYRCEAKDCRINPYCAKVLCLMRNNIDDQYVLDPYACIG